MKRLAAWVAVGLLLALLLGAIPGQSPLFAALEPKPEPGALIEVFRLTCQGVCAAPSP